jgi:predicted MFS family arabinose efflux permease
MTGLKLLADRVEGKLMARAVAGHAAGVGVAGAVSFLFADRIAALWGWQTAFAAAAACATTAFVMIGLLAPWRPRQPRPARPAALLDFGPVFRNRDAMAYAVAYCVHTWEMNALRGWAVAFLAYVAARATPEQVWISPAAVTTVMALVGTAASVLGNEASIAWGRVRLVRATLLASVLFGLVIGFAGVMDYRLATALIVVYGILVWLDSSSLTAGTTTSAEPARRGATLAIHSMLGYGGGFVGPLALGWVLDAMGGMSQAAWGAGFAATAMVVLAGRIAFDRLSRARSR